MLARWLVAVALTLLPAWHARAADPASRIVPPDEQPVKEIPFFVFSDTQISYRYQYPSANPGSQVREADGSFRNRDAPKHILGIAHADAWAYGTNFFALDILKSGSQFPAGLPTRRAASRPTITATPKPMASIAARSASTRSRAPKPSRSPAS